jgi:hypothetical protein
LIRATASVEELRRVSFVDEYTAEADTIFFYSVPLVAAVFGKRKLAVSQDRAAIEEDIRYLHRFGAIRPPEVQQGIGPTDRSAGGRLPVPPVGTRGARPI